MLSHEEALYATILASCVPLYPLCWVFFFFFLSHALSFVSFRPRTSTAGVSRVLTNEGNAQHTLSLSQLPRMSPSTCDQQTQNLNPNHAWCPMRHLHTEDFRPWLTQIYLHKQKQSIVTSSVLGLLHKSNQLLISDYPLKSNVITSLTSLVHK